MNIFLIGYRGTGKSTVARLLAERLDYPHVDADDEIERSAGKSIAAIFADEGEAAFRDLESEIVANLAGRDRTIAALGGGAVLRMENRHAVRGRGLVVWLRADAETLLARISADTTTGQRRPNLTAAGGFDEIRQLLAVREPIYRQSADHVVDTQGKSPAEVVDEILAFLQKTGFGRPA